jgi:hypothetical protein
MKLLRVVPSTNPKKKFDAIFEQDTGRTKKVSFGAKGMEDFTTTKDEARKARYLARHRAREDWNKPDSAGALSRWILWNLPTFNASLADYKRRFNL